MKIVAFFIKPIISVLCRLLVINKDVKKFVFKKLLRNEIVDFIENEYYSEYEHIKRSITFLKANITNTDYVILDIGGAYGKTAIIYASNFPAHKVYVYEPIKDTFDALVNNTKMHPNIQPINKAVGNVNRKDTINVAQRVTSSSLFELIPDGSSRIFADSLKKVKTEEITICRIDDEFPSDTNVGLIKIDVQGYEIEALKGAFKIMQSTFIILLEVNNHNGYAGSPKYFEIDELMRSHGFILGDICPSTRDKGRLKEWDVFYINKKFYEDWNN
jgi:FkbM family methyltransferase